MCIDGSGGLVNIHFYEMNEARDDSASDCTCDQEIVSIRQGRIIDEEYSG